jgi:branched-chain amino acid transport system permease protein
MTSSAAAEPQRYLEAQIRWRPLEIAFWLATLLPFVLTPNYLLLASQIAITALFALSLDLILGYAGIVSLGHAAYFGFGSYTAGLIAKWGWGEPLTGLIIAAAAAGVLGYLTSFIIARFRHLALIMITLGLGLLLAEAANSASWLTGGADGLQGVRMWKLFGMFQFDLFGTTAYGYSLAVLFLLFLVARPGLARHPRECGPHARHRSGESRAHPQGLHDRRRHGRHRRCVARPDHRDRLARDTELPTLG